MRLTVNMVSLLQYDCIVGFVQRCSISTLALMALFSDGLWTWFIIYMRTDWVCPTACGKCVLQVVVCWLCPASLN